MTFEEAFRKSVKAYFDGLAPSALHKTAEKKPRYTKKYFDKVGKEYDIEPVGKEKGYK